MLTLKSVLAGQHQLQMEHVCNIKHVFLNLQCNEYCDRR